MKQYLVRIARGGRRPMLSRKGLGLVTVLLLACGFDSVKDTKKDTTAETKDMAGIGTGALLARPHPPVVEAPEQGLRPLGLGGKRDGLLYVPKGYRADRPAPLVVMLHGAGGNARHALSPWQKFADEAGLLLLAPESRGPTWDIIAEDGYGPDVAFINRALAHVFERYAVDSRHIAIEGFSDGASHALSHGMKDEVLRIGPCSRRIVPLVRRAGYTVRYREFDGPHTVPADIAREALVWFTAR